MMEVVSFSGDGLRNLSGIAGGVGAGIKGADVSARGRSTTEITDDGEWRDI